ncbi:2-polyprenyl-6-methoxyphenol hydroxylase [Allokutzneria albata]|uniref:2-polyprenyl-6-methoxyphenol hydroxylase n=1 Tax=Allokutzneria albata TaxID=211114 RepID=A0A1G9TXC2_ALLAB|nr:2-polyprenyl-6-methoxyphenol hydroxylase [Allokutzneria albata]
MRTTHVPVLVVGAGPVGLSTAAFLAHWGVSALVIDKRDPTTAPPRAGASLRTLEIFRSIGMGEEFAAAGWLAAPPMRTVHKDSAKGNVLHLSELPPEYSGRLETCSPVDARLTLTQREIQRVLLRHVGGNTRFGVRLLDFTLNDDAVSARVVDEQTGQEEELTADYLIGADGAGSPVRQRLGITMPDRTVVGHLTTAFYQADLGDIVDEWGTNLCFVRNEQVYGTIFSKNGRDQWSSHIMDYPGKPEGPAELSEQDTIRLLRAMIGDATAEIRLDAVNAWTAALGIASEFRRGRAFLAGDAAHVQSSAGGLGMNTGIQDGHNLAWKLAAVLKGESKPSLLDTYEPERRAAAEASLDLSRRMHEAYLQRLTDPPAAIADAYLRAMMFHGYPDVLVDSVTVGARYPHRWLDPEQTVSSLDDSGWRLAEGPVLIRPDGIVAWTA